MEPKKITKSNIFEEPQVHHDNSMSFSDVTNEDAMDILNMLQM